MRTTSGPTSRNEVVPSGHSHPRSRLTGERRDRRVRRRAHFVRAQRLRRGRRQSGSYGRRSLPPAVSVAVAAKAGDHGVSDPAGRSRRGPAPVRRGRSRHGCHCRRSCTGPAWRAAGSAACLLHQTRRKSARFVRTISSGLSRKSSACGTSGSGRIGASTSPGDCPRTCGGWEL